MDETENKVHSVRSYIYLSALLLGALIMFVLAQNILAVKLVLMGIICLKAYGFLIKEIKYEFWSCLLYMGVLAYFLVNHW